MAARRLIYWLKAVLIGLVVLAAAPVAVILFIKYVVKLHDLIEKL